MHARDSFRGRSWRGAHLRAARRTRRILITGSSGQIGTNLALRLSRDGHSVFGVDKRQNTWTDAFPTLLQDLAGRYPAFHGGIGGVEYPAVDVVVHLAAHAKVHQLVAQPHLALENAVMTFNVLEFCRGIKVPVVFSSTREVYGDVRRFEGYGEATADFAFTESPYSASKIAAEALIYSYARCYELPYLVFRFSNVYGRYDNDLHRMVRVLPLFIHLMLRGEPITIYGREKVLDFTYVDDCVDGIARGVEALAAGRLRNETINLAFGEGNTLLRAAALIAEQLEVEPRIDTAPARLGEVTHYIADIRKARDLLGWRPEIALEDGIPRAVAWFLEHRGAHPEEHSTMATEGPTMGWKSQVPASPVTA
jgi:nucleoside-diphosphate-sugar epimerase